MQSTGSRIALVVVAAVVVVVAFLVLSPTDDEPQQSANPAQEEAPADTGGGGGDGGGQPGGGDSEPAEPEVPTVEVRNGQPVGGVQEIEVESGERAEFVVESNTPDELHLHGYDLYKDVGPGQPARFGFPADLEGVFEVEMHDAGHVVVAELRVTP